MPAQPKHNQKPLQNVLKNLINQQNESNFIQNSTNFTQNSTNFTQNSTNFTQNSTNFTQNSTNFTQNSTNFTSTSTINWDTISKTTAISRYPYLNCSVEFILDDTLLGTGSFSSVCLAQNTHSNEFVAAKMTDLSKNRLYYDKEVRALTAIPPHRNIIPLIQYGEDGDTGYIFTEFNQNSKTLLDYVQEKGELSEEESLTILDQLLDGLKVIHDAKFSHNDLKPENVLYDPTTKRACIFDFGLSTEQTTDTPQIEEISGTPLYMAPEILTGKPRSHFLSDIWSLGLIFYYMLVGDLPWSNASTLPELINAVLSGKLYIPKNIKISTISCQLLAGMLQLKPSARWSLEKIKLGVRKALLALRKISDVGKKKGFWSPFMQVYRI